VTSKAKSDANGVRAMDAPVSNTRPKFGWRVGTESEAVEATTAGLATEVVEAADVGSTAVVGMSPIRETCR